MYKYDVNINEKEKLIKSMIKPIIDELFEFIKIQNIWQ